MADNTKEEAKKVERKKARKKALELAALSAAASVAPTAAEVIVQKTEAKPATSVSPAVQVPEPPRYEWSKPRPLKTIADFLRGVFGTSRARAEAASIDAGGGGGSGPGFPMTRNEQVNNFLPTVGFATYVRMNINGKWVDGFLVPTAVSDQGTTQYDFVDMQNQPLVIGIRPPSSNVPHTTASGVSQIAESQVTRPTLIPVDQVINQEASRAVAGATPVTISPANVYGTPAAIEAQTAIAQARLPSTSAPFGGPLAPSQPATTPESSVYGTPAATEAQRAIAEARSPTQATPPTVSPASQPSGGGGSDTETPIPFPPDAPMRSVPSSIDSMATAAQSGEMIPSVVQNVQGDWVAGFTQSNPDGSFTTYDEQGGIILQSEPTGEQNVSPASQPDPSALDQVAPGGETGGPAPESASGGPDAFEVDHAQNSQGEGGSETESPDGGGDEGHGGFV